MRALIAQARATLPFDDPQALVCNGDCDRCALKLLTFLDQQLDDWRARLDAGESPTLHQVSELGRLCRQVAFALALP